MSPPDVPAAPRNEGTGGSSAVFACAPLPASQTQTQTQTGSSVSARKASVLKKRRDFLLAARAKRAPVEGFLLQARKRETAESATIAPDSIRVGYTCSKKVGNAVHRNRAKRRLREIAREILPQAGHSGWDYVLVGKPGATIARDFDALRTDMRRALARIHPKRD